jgi:transcriptional regulator with XRE-family HTH domain
MPRNHKLGLVVPLRRTDPAGAEMRRAILETGLDQAELAAVLGVSTRTLRRWWRGEGLGALPAFLKMRAMESERRRAA